MKKIISKAIFGRLRISRLILISVAFVSVFTFANTIHAAIAEIGTNNAYSAGNIQTVPDGYGLTAVGYGSDDWKCVIGIKTAPVNADGSVDFSQADSNWQDTNCANGTPGSDKASFEKVFEPAPNSVVTGWSWGADTTGGSPDSDSFPDDECFYQEYRNLATGQVFSWGQSNTGSCAGRGYDDVSWLKNVARAPAGRVIIGLKFNIDNDASLDFLAVSSGVVTASGGGGGGGGGGGSTSCSLVANTTTITAGQSVGWTVNSNPSGLPYFWYTSGPVVQNHVAGEGTGLTPFSGSYAVNTPGTYQVYFTVENPGVLCTSNTVTITVNPATTGTTFDFSLSNEGDKNVTQGSSVTNAVTSTLVSGTSQSVSYSVSGLPAGASSSFSPNACSPTCSTNLTINTSTLTPTGTFPITVTGTGGGVTKTTTFNLVVSSSIPSGTACSLSASATTITAGQTVTYTASSTPGALPYFWFVSGASTQSHVPGEGSGLTPWTGTYTYANPGSYAVFFTIENSVGVTICMSNTINLNVNSGGGGGGGGGQPTIVLNPTSLTFTTASSSSPAAQSFNIQDTGNATLNWTANVQYVEGNNWLSLSTVTGSLAATASTGETVIISSNNLAPGVYHANITISDPNATNNPQTETVTLTVNPFSSGTSCSLTANTTTISQGQTVTYTASSTPGALPYFWFVSGASTQSHVPGEGSGLTPWTGTYTYANPGSYAVFFTIENPLGVTTCISNTINLTVNSTGGGGGGGGGGSGGGGGGGGGVSYGGAGPLYQEFSIYNEGVSQTAPGVAMVTWNTTLPATRRIVWDTVSHPSMDYTPNLGYATSSELISSPLLTLHSMVAGGLDPNKTYYFRAISTEASTTGFERKAVSRELVLGPGGSSGGVLPSDCYYLHDYLRKDFNNNPEEVKKLQIFLRDLEGYSNLQVTGIYDDATIAVVNAFQVRYSNDILTPWGYDGTTGTGYVYILTKKKVNEIYCRAAFPVTPQQQSEIDATKAFFLSLRNAGININHNAGEQYIPTGNGGTVPINNNILGIKTGNSSESTITSTSSGEFVFSGSTTTTENTDNSGGFFGSLAANVQTALGQFSFSRWLNLLLILLILIILYFWYQEYSNNKRIEVLNKQIDAESRKVEVEKSKNL